MRPLAFKECVPKFPRSIRWNFDQKMRHLHDAVLIAGTDEVGRGALAGPLVVTAVVLPPTYDNSKIQDSKAISNKVRELLFEEIQEVAITYSIEILSSTTVDNLNPKKTTLLGMERCLKNLKPTPDFCLIDGDQDLTISGLKTEAVIKGDNLSLSVAAASILAKVSRDRLMIDYDAVYHGYNFSKHKGYGTAEHLENLNQFGITAIHRKSYNPIAKFSKK